MNVEIAAQEDKYRRERLQKLKDSEQYIIDSLQANDMIRKQQMALISEQFKSQMKDLESHTKSRLKEEEYYRLENKVNERIMDLMELKMREERVSALKVDLK
jgi:uncharacterized protein YbaP (TraB family)